MKRVEGIALVMATMVVFVVGGLLGWLTDAALRQSASQGASLRGLQAVQVAKSAYSWRAKDVYNSDCNVTAGDEVTTLTLGNFDVLLTCSGPLSSNRSDGVIKTPSGDFKLYQLEVVATSNDVTDPQDTLFVQRRFLGVVRHKQ